MIKDISVLIAGKAGDGVLFTGNVLAKVLKRHGWEVATYRDFPSNIRSEPTNYTIRASVNKIYGRGDEINILLAFSCEAIYEHYHKVAEGGAVLCDGEEVLKLPPLIEGSPGDSLGIMGFGSTYGPLQEAALQLREKGIATQHFHFRTLWPFPSPEVEDFIKGCKKIFIVENNYSAQLSTLIQSQIKFPFTFENLLLYTGEPFRPKDISEKIQMSG